MLRPRQREIWRARLSGFRRHHHRPDYPVSNRLLKETAFRLGVARLPAESFGPPSSPGWLTLSLPRPSRAGSSRNLSRGVSTSVVLRTRRLVGATPYDHWLPKSRECLSHWFSRNNRTRSGGDFQSCFVLSTNRRHAIPPSPEGDGPLASFLWRRPKRNEAALVRAASRMGIRGDVGVAVQADLRRFRQAARPISGKTLKAIARVAGSGTVATPVIELLRPDSSLLPAMVSISSTVIE